MAPGFSFGFSGDDIDMDIEDTGTHDIGSGAQESQGTSNLPELVKAQKDDMGAWVCIFPFQ